MIGTFFKVKSFKNNKVYGHLNGPPSYLSLLLISHYVCTWSGMCGNILFHYLDKCDHCSPISERNVDILLWSCCKDIFGIEQICATYFLTFIL